MERENNRGALMLNFNLIGYWFDKTESGEKPAEYRIVKPYWTKRILNVAKGNSVLEKFLKEDVPMLQGFYNKGVRAVEGSVAGLKIPCRCIRGYNYKRTFEKEICKIGVVDGANTDLRVNELVYVFEYTKEI